MEEVSQENLVTTKLLVGSVSAGLRKYSMSDLVKKHNLGQFDAFMGEISLYEFDNGRLGATVVWSSDDLELSVVIESLEKLNQRLQCIATDIQFQPDGNDAMFEIVAKRKESAQQELTQ